MELGRILEKEKDQSQRMEEVSLGKRERVHLGIDGKSVVENRFVLEIRRSRQRNEGS